MLFHYETHIKSLKGFGGISFSLLREKGHESSMVRLRQNHKQQHEIKSIFTNEEKWLVQIGTKMVKK
jgi:hypothetical protein